MHIIYALCQLQHAAVSAEERRLDWTLELERRHKETKRSTGDQRDLKGHQQQPQQQQQRPVISLTPSFQCIMLIAAVAIRTCITYCHVIPLPSSVYFSAQ